MRKSVGGADLDKIGLGHVQFSRSVVSDSVTLGVLSKPLRRDV